jgi:hypothetical protein
LRENPAHRESQWSARGVFDSDQIAHHEGKTTVEIMPACRFPPPWSVEGTHGEFSHRDASLFPPLHELCERDPTENE